jgi:hypothetical protein
MNFYELPLFPCGGVAAFDGTKYGNFNTICHNGTKTDTHLTHSMLHSTHNTETNVQKKQM